jgi:hypothetical protein
MHLVGPYLSTTGKRRGKTKFRNATEAQRARELDKEWTDLQKRWGVEAEDKKKSRAMSAKPLTYNLSAPVGRQTTSHIPSRDSGHTGAVSSKPTQHYTGTKMLGIGTLHKSNSVPIFSDEEAIDIAKMRR